VFLCRSGKRLNERSFWTEVVAVRSYTDGAEVESDRTSSLWPQKSAHQLKPSLGRPRLRSDGKTTFNGDFIAARLRKGGKRHEWVYRGEEMACSWRLYK